MSFTHRVIVADDHALVRAGLISLIGALPDFEVVGEAGDGREVLKLVSRLEPEVVIMDIAMPELNGLGAAERIHSSHPKTKVIILSMHADEEYVAQALRAGVAGYLLKGAARDELETALKVVTFGQTYLSPSISRQVVENFMHGGPTALSQLTSRQREILQLIAEGKSTREIAKLLHVSVKTVETHRSRLMERLDMHDTAALVRFAVSKGLITT